MRKNEKGFTLVELLAVIVILGLLMAIAIPSVTKYITQSRVKTLTKTMDSYITAVVTQVNNGEYKFSDSTKVFAIPIECVSLEKGGTNPFGNWYQANSSYWAYVLVHYDSANYNYEYGFTFKDDAGYGLYPTLNANITSSMVKTGYDDLSQPQDGLAVDFVEASKWEGFSNITSTTELVVLEAESEGYAGDGENTCTLCQKGDNYDAVEEEKIEKMEATEADSGTLINSGSSSSLVFGHSLKRSTIESITLLDNKRVPRDAIEWWDASVEQQKGIKAWILDEDNNGKYELYIGQKGGVTAPADSSYLFYDYSYAKNVDVTKLDTSNVTNMSYMFAFNAATELDLSNFNTSKVTNMSMMFAFAANVTKLDISSFNTSNVTTMQSMFALCQGIRTLDLRHFDVSKVTNMSAMFSQSTIESINTTGWNTSNVTDMSAMFMNTSIPIIDLRHFNTSKVTTMYNMFQFCDETTSINLSGWNTSNVTTMENMFAWNDNLKTIDLTGWNTSKVTNMAFMFRDTASLTTLNLSSFNTINVTTMENMFAYSGVGTLTLGSNFTTKNTTDLSDMFFNAPNVRTRIALRNPNAQTWSMFGLAATSSTARIYVDYTSATYSMAYDLVYYSGTGLRLSMGYRVS